MSTVALFWIDSIQVGNFFAKALLRYLATHNFHKPGFFFKNSTYMTALEISEKTLQRALTHLENDNLITIEHRFDENGRQISNGIYLNIPDEFLNNYEKMIGEGVRSDGKNSPPQSTTLGSSSSRPPHRLIDDPYNSNITNIKSNNNIGEEITKKRKKKRKPEKPIPDNYLYNDTHKIIATSFNVDIDHQFEIFKDHALQNERLCRNWDAAFRNWLRKAPEYKPRIVKNKNNLKENRLNEATSIVNNMEFNQCDNDFYKKYYGIIDSSIKEGNSNETIQREITRDQPGRNGVQKASRYLPSYR
jgi:hypothetical protein